MAKTKSWNVPLRLRHCEVLAALRSYRYRKPANPAQINTFPFVKNYFVAQYL